ncbi:FkbM family methyltransferase [Jannaschia sp. CCS1]|uniref:FkbM family methyltransferase n=1 Tax=Jannaschia sp. (strain CCS1) TaxID=290400 RepID=UPI000053DB6F|nr:FkbM family methyltransferase [Jannaschia sp. CCS1]ABD57166.1 Methyltransferase FkbM [Jannaschia sp. CCS1]
MKEIVPFLSENGFFFTARLFCSELFVVRKTYIANVSGVSLTFRSFSSDAHVINAWLRSPLPAHYIDAAVHDGIIIDAGGNIGAAAVAFALHFPDKQIITVEPSRVNFAILKKNTRSFDNIIALNCAIGPDDESAYLEDTTGTTDGFTVVTGPGRTDHTALEEIEIRSVPSLLKDVAAQEIAILKIDIEGFEYELLTPPPNWISKVHLVAIELHERLRPGATRAYVNATNKGRIDLGFLGEMYFSKRDRPGKAKLGP